MRQNAKESFDRLTELLFQKYRENGDDVDALILAKQDRMGTDYDTAFEEFVADSMEAMLTDTNAAERIAGLKETDKTAWEKLKELVHKLLESIRGLYEQYSPSSVEGKHVREMSDTLEKLSDLFVEGMGKVSEQGASEGKISYSIRSIGGQTLTVIDTDNNTQDVQVAEEYLKTLISSERPFSTILVDAQPVYIGKDLPGEYRSSEYTKSMKPALRNIKMQAATNLDEMLLLAEDGSWLKNIKPKHAKDAQNGWYRYKTEFAVPILNAKKP